MSIGNKDKAVQSVRMDFELLSNQSDEQERRAFFNRAHGALFTLRAAELVTDEEFKALQDEFSAANDKAISQLQVAQ